MTIETAIQAIAWVVTLATTLAVLKYRMDHQDRRFVVVFDFMKEATKEQAEMKQEISGHTITAKDRDARIFSLESSRTFMEDRVATMHGEIKVLKNQDDHLDHRLDALSSELRAAEGRIISRIDQLAKG